MRSAALRGQRNVVTRAAFLSPPVSAIFARSSGSSAASATAEAPSARAARSLNGLSAPPGRKKSPKAHAPKGMELHAKTGRPAVPVAAVAVCRTKSSGYRTSAANLCANQSVSRCYELRVDGVEVMIYALLRTSRSRRRAQLAPVRPAVRRRRTQQRVAGAACSRKNQTSAPSRRKTCQHSGSTAAVSEVAQ